MNMSNFNHDDICTEINSIILNGISKKDQEICNLKDTIRKMEEKMRFMDDSKTIKKKEKFFDEQMKRYFEKERLLQEEIEELRNERDIILEKQEIKFSNIQSLENLIKTHKSDLQEKTRMIALLQDKLKSFDRNINTKYNILKESYQLFV